MMPYTVIGKKGEAIIGFPSLLFLSAGSDIRFAKCRFIISATRDKKIRLLYLL